MINIRRFLILLLLLPALAGASLSNRELEQEAKVIADQLRCPVCRGIPITDSPSELARDMVKIIHQKLEAGESEEAIIDYFAARYGEWILLKPKPQGLNLMVWVLPALLLSGGAIFLAFKVKRWSSSKT